MKSILLFLLAVGTAFTLQAQTPEYTITSNIQNFADSTFNLTIWNGGSQAERKSAKVKDGQVYYRDTSSVPLVIRIELPTEAMYKRTGSGYMPVKSQHIWLVAMPGKTIHLSGHLSDFAEVYPSGDKENDVIRELNSVYHPLINQSANTSLKLGDKTLSEAEVANLKKKQAAISKQANAYMVSFLKKNASSIAGMYYINDMLLRDVVTIEMAEELLPTIKSSYKNTAFYKTIEQRIAGSKFDVGRPIFKISSSNTLDGQLFSIDAWKGKFYLIDFWGSWCGPCIADVPDLKKLKEQFPDQLEILGIAQDTDKPWRAAIKSHELNWAHILNGTQNDDFVSRLNVTGFPTKILVDPNGTIVYRSSGGGESSFQKMAEIIKAWKN